MVIKQALFNHKGGRYLYMMHTEKIRKLCIGKFKVIEEYLHSLLENCPNDYFNNGPRGSCLKFKLIDSVMVVKGHEVSSLAKRALEINRERFKDKHSKIQTFMLENDDNTLAMEVPIWLMPNELARYESLFKSNEILTGHIDILRVEDGKVWVWDYKPNAHQEIYASTQTFFYAYMLSKRTSMPLDDFRCGYFDHNFAFIYKPKNEFIINLNKQKLLF